MAYRAPRYSYIHAARDVGASEITLSHAEDSDFPKANLIDDRGGTLFKFGASQSSPTIDIDLGSGFVTGLNRLIIPANHNIGSITVRQDDDPGYGSMEILHPTDTGINPGEFYDSGEFGTKASTQRYIRVTLNGTTLFYLPQLVLTQIMTLSVGPLLENKIDMKIDNVTRLKQNTGQSPTIKHGPQQRVIQYPYPYPFSGTDLTNMEAFVDAVGMELPFWVDPAVWTPFSDEPALWMKFADMPDIRIATTVPMSGVREKTYVLDLIESVD